MTTGPEIQAAVHGGAPPNPPEFPAGAETPPRWPVWYAPVGFIGGFTVTLVVSVFVGLIAAAAGADIEGETPPGLVVVLTLLQALILCGTAVVLAARTRRPRAWHFGLRRARFWPSLGWTAAGFGAFFVFALVYQALVSPEGEQSVTEDLGADESTLALVGAGIVVIVVAPIAEEFFFRGFFYRALRTRLGIVVAATIDGVVFGLIHYTGSETLELLPVLAVLGVVFCLVYERTGTLYTAIGLHAFNNAIAYGVATDSAEVSLIVGPLMLAGCMAAPRLLHPARSPARA
ncbi:MAG TPA: type II CAAX endopeptidase family protein [Thermoleophilaceae bacterium]|nr:type II CAAX endopeptidase family protein [Thermoleophilaceae bacterium]